MKTSSELSLGLAHAADANAIADMSRELIENGLRWRWTEQRVAVSINADDTNVLVARLDNRLAGFGIMKYGDQVAHLNLFAVAPAHRRSGIGRQLLRWLERCASVAGNVAISLEVRASNTGAQRFYESMGYRTLVELPGYYQGVEPALRMGRRLTVNKT
jgi:ribosomal-protein-alanine N-acetyltransferase